MNMVFRRPMASLLCMLLTVLAGVGLATTVASPAAAALSDSTVPPVVDNAPDAVTADALPTAQINGVVWDQAVVGDTVFAVGEFTSARPAGSALGVNESPRTNVMSYNVRTGVMTSWAPNVNGRVRTITASPDGTRIYIGGSFTQVEGELRSRIAAFDAATGALVPGFAPIVGSDVFAIAATDDVVYLGGWFASVDGVARSRLAAVNANGGVLTGWAPSADYTVWAMDLTSAADRVVVAGAFQKLNGAPATSLGSISAVDGTAYPFGANQVIHNYGDTAAMMSMKVVDDKAYSAAYWFGGTGNFEGGVIADAYDGTILNMANCLGDTYDMVPMNGLAYMTSHHHQCTDSGGYHETRPTHTQHLDAVTIEPTGQVQRQTYGYPNFQGQPSGSYVNWFPVTYGGRASGINQAGWTLEATKDYLLVGGEFPVVNGEDQQGLVRFTTRANSALKKVGPSATASSITPTLRNVGETRTRVRWQADFDRDGMDLTYNVQRRIKSTTPITIVQSVTGKSTFFQRPGMQIVDETVVVGTTYQYRLHVVDADGNARYTPWVDITAGADIAASSVYANQVFADGADHYWKLNDAAGSTQINDWAGADVLTTSNSGITFGKSGAIIGSTDPAASVNGNNLVKARGAETGLAPERYSSELWFRTTTNRGGKLLGFGSGGIGNSPKYDRHVYMGNDGRLTYGIYNNSYAATSSKAFNDGQWHHVVTSLSEGELEFYVDGIRVGRKSVLRSGMPYIGRWHLGGDNLSGWANRPTSDFFAGDIDDVAIYANPLTQEQIRDHYTKSGRTVDIPAPPSDNYGKKVVVDEPLLYWRLGEPVGATAARDSSINSFDGTYRNGPTLGQPSEVTSGNTAVLFDGVDDVVSSDLPFSNPTVFSLESWIKTTTTTGGKIIGFGSQQTGNSSSYDRHVYMNAVGQLRFGAYTGALNVAGSVDSYNDGTWHHVVATLGPAGMRLYVDGALVATDPNTGAEDYTGYWRVGGDNTWEGAKYFDGTIDEAAVYDHVLGATDVLDHYNLSTIVENQPPVAAFTETVAGLSVEFDSAGSSDPDGDALSYAWVFGDGETSSEASPSHTFDAAGTYTVSLTVSDGRGGSDDFTKDVTVTPENQAPVAAFTETVSGLSAVFDSAGSSDPDGDALTYAWAFGDGGTSSEANPSHTYAAAGAYTVSLTVSDGKGGSDEFTKDVTVSESAVAGDAFGRTAASGWGTADMGGAWTVNSASTMSVDGSSAVARFPWAVSTRTAYLNSVSASDVSVVTDVALDQAPIGGMYYHQMLARVSDEGNYKMTVRLDPSGSARVYVSKVAAGSETILQTTVLSGFDYLAGEELKMRFDVTGDDAVALEGKVWRAGDAEPASAMVSATDSAATLPAGGLGLKMYAGGGLSSLPLIVSIADYQASVPIITVPENQAPEAAFTQVVSALSVLFDGTGSSDPDGDSLTYAWMFGDGVSSTEESPSHTYDAAGTYTVSLTVSDGNGGSDELSKDITVAESAIVADAFDRTVGSGWGTADVGGAWTVNSGSTMSVDGSQAVTTFPWAVSTRTAYLNSVSASDLSILTDLTLDKAPEGGHYYHQVVARVSGSSYYVLTVRLESTGRAVIYASKRVSGSETTLQTTVLSGFDYSDGEELKIRFDVVGDASVALSGTVWRASDAEPASTTVSAVDSSATLPAGGLGLRMYVGGGLSSLPVNVTIADYQAGLQ